MNVEEGVSLSRYTTLGTGGPARYFAAPSTEDELVELLAWARGRGPRGRAGRARLEPARRGRGLPRPRSEAEWRPGRGARGGRARSIAGGGASLAVCLHRARDAGLGGFEFACAIPGTVGGAVWMNAGAYGSDISQVLERALVADAGGAEWQTPAELGLSYRHSGLTQGQIVAGAEFRLYPKPVDEIKATVAELQAQRKEAQPTNKRTFGSVFKNPDHELSAGRMLEACGLRGFAIGGATISPKHANFIENAGGATTADARRADRRGSSPCARAVRRAARAGGAAARTGRDSRVGRAAPAAKNPACREERPLPLRARRPAGLPCPCPRAPFGASSPSPSAWSPRLPSGTCSRARRRSSPCETIKITGAKREVKQEVRAALAAVPGQEPRRHRSRRSGAHAGRRPGGALRARRPRVSEHAEDPGAGRAPARRLPRRCQGVGDRAHRPGARGDQAGRRSRGSRASRRRSRARRAWGRRSPARMR